MSRDCKTCGSPEGGDEALCQKCAVAAQPTLREGPGYWTNVRDGQWRDGAVRFVQEPINELVVVDLPPMDYFTLREREQAEEDFWREFWRDQD